MQRLKTRPQFQAAMAAGTVSRTAHFALHRLVLTEQGGAMAPPTGPGSQDPQALFGVGAVRRDAWLGAMVPKRWARRSVTRHTIKRQIYAVGSEHETLMLQGAHVVRLRSGFDRRQFVSATSDVLRQAVRAELQQLFAYAAKRLSQPATELPQPAQERVAAAGESIGVAP
ncbi:ribonuclease P protein component [Delftia acidovorans]|uniref:ribonuclease P protein component n=1 Tax=Delftia acidovorans TaxID=80866 RepID=UPI000BE3FE70|nr:ribonuclease P protein component [Delftia acidovorans]